MKHGKDPLSIERRIPGASKSDSFGTAFRLGQQKRCNVRVSQSEQTILLLWGSGSDLQRHELAVRVGCVVCEGIAVCESEFGVQASRRLKEDH